MVEKEFLLNKGMLEPKSRDIISFLEEKIDNNIIKDFLINYIAGEEGIAYEFLCSEIYASKIKLSKDIFFLIKEECLQYEVKEFYWQDLEKLIID
ncbi:MAG: hypothetical protein SZ59_C0003G0014 [candidate division TM6 bacterium GW2011_GWF2_28_16]|nr:MAG: hypothetical protein SZ59_C0003G0014 [candidate division TM6 bacterium GW2011_GWF2_28_16]